MAKAVNGNAMPKIKIMNFKTIKLSEEIDYFFQIPDLYPIPTNYVINKRLPGLGATHGEIICERHSIIIIANVPPIAGKKSKHPEILAVYKGIYEEDVVSYLLNDGTKFKKILCTPEAFTKKVKPAIESVDAFNLYADFFLLYDECDKVISDVDYRPAIALPMDDFFLFKNKAMISATPIFPTDPMFEEEGFTFVQLEPDYTYQKDLKLIVTNNVLESLRVYLNDLNEQCFIFLNSTDAIYSIMEKLNILKDSKVFCAKDSVSKLQRARGFSMAHESLTPFAMNNFFTSRFNSAVDINLPEDANVIIISDVHFALHSAVDPMTDVIQIQGRFRVDKIANKKLKIKRKGCKSITHITNCNNRINHMTEEKAESYLHGAIDILRTLIKLRKTTSNPGGIATLKQAIAGTGLDNYLNDEGKLNYFMVDNFINYEKIKSYYSSKEALVEAYEKSNFFNVVCSEETYPISDHDKLKRSDSSTPAILQSLSHQLEALSDKPGEFVFRLFDVAEHRNEIKKLNPFIFEAYNTLGFAKLEECYFVKANIKNALNESKWQIALESNALLKADVKHRFPFGTYSEVQLKKGLEEIYKKHEIKIKVSPSHINKFASARRSTDKDGKKTYLIKDYNKVTEDKFISRLFKNILS